MKSLKTLLPVFTLATILNAGGSAMAVQSAMPGSTLNLQPDQTLSMGECVEKLLMLQQVRHDTRMSDDDLSLPTETEFRLLYCGPQQGAFLPAPPALDSNGNLVPTP